MLTRCKNESVGDLYSPTKGLCSIARVAESDRGSKITWFLVLV